MGRTSLAVVAILLVAGALAIVLLVTGVFSGTSSAKAAPACLPATLTHSARLPGVGVAVSPAPETDTANPDTQISFLGVPPSEIHEVSVVGQRSGAHAGRMRPYFQGDGASFVPEDAFAAGERVTVRATVGPGKGKAVSFAFRVDTPYSTAGTGPFPNPAAPAGEYQSFRTLPGVQAPVLTVTTPDRDPAAGEVLTTNGPGPGAYGPLIYTPQGRLVWFDQLAGGLTAEDLSVQSYEGERDLTFWQGKVLDLGFGQGEDLVLNSHYQTVAKVHGGNGLEADLHEFQVAPRAVAYITAYNPIHCDLSSQSGAHNGVIIDTAIQEIDMKTGLVRWEWHSLDHVSVADSQTAAPTDATPWDWFHLNSIDLEPSGNLFISARSTWAGYELEGASGNVLWRLGGSNSSFKLGPGAETAWQHDGRVLPNGEITFFDDGSNPPEHHQSRAVRIALDFMTHEARLNAAYTLAPTVLAASQGNVQTLAGGNTVVNYGAVPAIVEYAPDGTILFDAHLPLDMDSYRGYRFPWSGRPLYPPTVLANLNNTGEETLVHMSWNGASDVASWRVLAGQKASSLAPRATIPASSFEGEAILPEKWTYVEVQALDPSGNVLGSSSRVSVGSYDSAFASTGATR